MWVNIQCFCTFRAYWVFKWPILHVKIDQSNIWHFTIWTLCHSAIIPFYHSKFDKNYSFSSLIWPPKVKRDPGPGEEPPGHWGLRSSSRTTLRPGRGDHRLPGLGNRKEPPGARESPKKPRTSKAHQGEIAQDFQAPGVGEEPPRSRRLITQGLQ